MEDDQSAEVDANSGMRCPYCRSTESCEQMLLSVDLTFRDAGSGLLFEAFDQRWYETLERGEDDSNFNERDAFDELLEEVNAHADFEMTLDSDTAPGMSSTYQLYYCSSSEVARTALESFQKSN